MSKAEDYIVNNMENGLITGWDDKNRPICQPWLTPDQARKAVEIAREEITERALIAFQVVCNRPAKLFPNCEARCNACEQFKQAMKDE